MTTFIIFLYQREREKLGAFVGCLASVCTGLTIILSYPGFARSWESAVETKQ